MKLFLCSHFSSVGSRIKEEIENKKVAFISTASLREGYTGYSPSAVVQAYAARSPGYTVNAARTIVPAEDFLQV